MSGEHLILDDPQLAAVLNESLKVFFALEDLQPEAVSAQYPILEYAALEEDALDEAIASERLLAAADLYVLYQHEMSGVFRVIAKLQALLRAGTLHLRDGAAIFALYHFDHREALRWNRRDRQQAYAHLFGYGQAALSNRRFHPLLNRLTQQLTRYQRDQRLLAALPPVPNTPSGCLADVRRAAHDLRANLLQASYGQVNVLRVEVMQLLDEALRLLALPELRQQFGAESGWDVVDMVQARYFNVQAKSAPRVRMASAGRELLRWLAQPDVLLAPRPLFEAQALRLAAPAEDWLTAQQMLRSQLNG